MKPATPLPWRCDTNPDDWGLVTETDLPNVEPIIFCGDRSNVPREQDLKYVAHAANLYPKLVEFVRDCEGEFHCQFPEHENCGPCGACKLAVRLATLLKECGE